MQIVAPTPTPASSYLRPPGLASLGPVLAMAASPYRLPTVGEWVGILPTIGGGRASGLLSPEAVEFVIVLELKTASPASP
ncbi:MAG: hypothetical protein FJ014_18905 [Chloroflexi bacterium]|nr:hypothetical protein [Chloroflexota bacterium]